jgi:hypothetical protein
MLTATARWIGIAAASILANAGLAISLFRMKRRAELLAIAREKAALDLQNLQQAFHRFAPRRPSCAFSMATLKQPGRTAAEREIRQRRPAGYAVLITL